MNTETYEQITARELLATRLLLIPPVVKVIFRREPSCRPPDTMELKVVSTDPHAKGRSAVAASTLETAWSYRFALLPKATIKWIHPRATSRVE